MEGPSDTIRYRPQSDVFDRLPLSLRVEPHGTQRPVMPRGGARQDEFVLGSVRRRTRSSNQPQRTSQGATRPACAKFAFGGTAPMKNSPVVVAGCAVLCAGL